MSSRFPRTPVGQRVARGAAAALLAVAAAFHLVWAFTPWPWGSWEELTQAVVGSTGEHPGIVACFAVSALSFLAAALAVGLWAASWVGKVGRLVAIAVLAARGVGGLVAGLVGMSDVRPFRTLDLVLYSPFCLATAALLVAGWWGEFWFGSHIRNAHARAIGRNGGPARAMLDSLGTENDAMWRTDLAPAMVMSDGPRPGSAGGHGMIRYHVTRYEPGSLVEWTFEPGLGLEGTHTMSIEACVETRGASGGDAGAEGAGGVGGGVVLRHVLDGELGGSMRVLWFLFVQPLHNGVIEDIFDHVERECTGQAHRTLRTSRLLRAVGRSMARMEARTTQTPIRA